MPVSELPAEIIDQILDHVFDCNLHRWSTLQKPCQNWHAPSLLPDLLRLRLVSKTFNTHLRPSLFYHITARGPARRHRTIVDLSWHPLATFVRILRMDIAPQDLPGQSQRVNNNALVGVDRKLVHYFEVLRIFLKPLLARFGAIRVLHITSTYDGIVERRTPVDRRIPNAREFKSGAQISTNDMMDACLEALCKGVRGAKLKYLEELTLGVPYEGGYTNFFEDLHDKKYSGLLRRCGRNLRSASVKLFDNQQNFTTMPFF